MDDGLRQLLLRKGFVRRREALHAGCSHKVQRRLLRLGELRLPAPDVLALPRAPTVDEALRSAVVALDGTATGLTAALLYDWPVAAAPALHVVTVDRDRSRLRRAGVQVARRDLAPPDLVERDGLRLTSALRTVLDCCRDLPLIQAVAVTDSALRAGDVAPAELEHALSLLPHGRARSRLARALSLADRRSESVLESMCRVVMVLGGVAPERLQHVVRGPLGRVGRVDFAWPSVRLAVEVDGFAWHRDRTAYRSGRRRLNGLSRAGWVLLRFTWEDVMGMPDEVVQAVRDVLLSADGSSASPAA